jgi:hypothetical protein
MNFAIISDKLSRVETNDEMDLASDWDIIVIGEISEEEIERHRKVYEDYPYVEAVRGEIMSYKNIYRLRDVDSPQEDIFTRLENMTI